MTGTARADDLSANAAVCEVGEYDENFSFSVRIDDTHHRPIHILASLMHNTMPTQIAR